MVKSGNGIAMLKTVSGGMITVTTDDEGLLLKNGKRRLRPHQHCECLSIEWHDPRGR
jgi:hypothetical protein